METITAGADPAASAKLPDLGGDAAPMSLARRIHRARWAVAGLLAAFLAATVLATAGSLRPTLAALGHMRWGFLPGLVLLSLLHYVCSAVALRGAAGRPLPLVRTAAARSAPPRPATPRAGSPTCAAARATSR